MKKIKIIFFLIPPFYSYSQTQAEISKEAFEEYKKSERTLDSLIMLINTEYKNDTSFISALNNGQILWDKFIQTQLFMIFPNNGEYYGSIAPMCRANYLENFTKERIKFLNQWVVGEEGGDACSGSKKIK